MNSELRARLDRVLKEDRVHTLCLRDPQIVAIDEGYVKLQLKITPDALNPYGMIHGGMLFTMSDSCAGLCAITLGHKAVTLNSSISFLTSVGSGMIYAESELVHAGKTTTVVQVKIRDERDRLLCSSTFTMFSLGSILEK